MQRRDFELIARTFAELRPSDDGSIEYGVSRRIWAQTVRVFSRRLQEANPSFDAERFVKACDKEL